MQQLLLQVCAQFGVFVESQCDLRAGDGEWAEKLVAIQDNYYKLREQLKQRDIELEDLRQQLGVCSKQNAQLTETIAEMEKELHLKTTNNGIPLLALDNRGHDVDANSADRKVNGNSHLPLAQNRNGP